VWAQDTKSLAFPNCCETSVSKTAKNYIKQKCRSYEADYSSLGSEDLKGFRCAALRGTSKGRLYSLSAQTGPRGLEQT